MEFYVINTNFEVLGVVDTYKSAIWTERYFTTGDFEIYLPATDANLALFKRHYFVVRADDPTKAGVIETLRITTSPDEGNYLTVTGKNVESILSRRIVWKQTTYSGKVENTIRRLVSDSMINPEEQGRIIPNFNLGEPIGLEDTLRIQFTGDNIEEAIQKLCLKYKLGYRVKFNIQTHGFLFEIYKGVDRSYNQSTNPFVVFSNDFDNLLSSDYTNDGSEFKNVAQVAGEGQGTARKKVVVGSVTGLERFETFINASDLSTNEGEISATDYSSILIQRGGEKLAQMAQIESLESTIEPNTLYKLNEDYFLGDIIEIVDEFGHAYQPRITEVIECQDDTGYSCLTTFAIDELEE